MEFIVTPARFGDNVTVKLAPSTKRKIQKILFYSTAVASCVYLAVDARNNIISSNLPPEV